MQRASDTSNHPADPPAPLLAWIGLARVYQKLYRVSGSRLRAYKLSVAQFDLLAQTGAAEGLTQQELADRLLVTKGDVSQLLDKMEHSGLIERRARGRSYGIFLTVSGRLLYDVIMPEHETLMVERFAVLSQPDLAQLIRSLRTLDRTLQ